MTTAILQRMRANLPNHQLARASEGRVRGDDLGPRRRAASPMPKGSRRCRVAGDKADDPQHSATVTTAAADPKKVAARNQTSNKCKRIIKGQESMVTEERAKTTAAIACIETQKRRAKAGRTQQLPTRSKRWRLWLVWTRFRDALAKEVQEHPSRLMAAVKDAKVVVLVLAYSFVAFRCICVLLAWKSL